MHNEQIHIKSGSESHKVLLHNAMGTGVGAAAIAQDYYGIRPRILFSEMLVPYPLNVVAYKPGSIVAGAYRHVSHILRDIVDAMRDNLTVRERGEVVVKGLGMTDGHNLSIPFEVADEFLLLGVDTDDRKVDFSRPLPDVRYVSELRVPVLDILHRKVLGEGTMAEAERVKYLANNIFGCVATSAGHFLGNHWDAHRYPDNILVLRQSGDMRGYNKFERVNPFRMSAEQGFPATAWATNVSRIRRIPRFDFFNGTVDCVFAHSEKLTNFVHATFTESKSLGSEISSSLVFVERRHKRQFFCCEHRWRRFRKHLNYRDIVFKFTNFSPVLQIYLIDNQIINYNFRKLLATCYRLIFGTAAKPGIMPKKFKLFFNVY